MTKVTVEKLKYPEPSLISGPSVVVFDCFTHNFCRRSYTALEYYCASGEYNPYGEIWYQYFFVAIVTVF